VEVIGGIDMKRVLPFVLLLALLPVCVAISFPQDIDSMTTAEIVQKAREIIPLAKNQLSEINKRIGSYVPYFLGPLMGDHEINVLVDDQVAGAIEFKGGRVTDIRSDAFRYPSLLIKTNVNSVKQILKDIKNGEDPITAVLSAKEAGLITVEPQKRLVLNVAKKFSNPVLAFVDVFKRMLFSFFG